MKSHEKFNSNHYIYQKSSYGVDSGKNVIGPYFFKNLVRNAITVNSERHRAMITDYFGTKF